MKMVRIVLQETMSERNVDAAWGCEFSDVVLTI
jgi:hypothetical protein